MINKNRQRDEELTENTQQLYLTQYCISPTFNLQYYNIRHAFKCI